MRLSKLHLENYRCFAVIDVELHPELTVFIAENGQGKSDEHQAKGWSLEHLAAVDLIPTNGKLSQFFSLTRQFFSPVADRILTQHGQPL